MTRIEELVESIKQPTTHYADQDFYDISIERILKEFAIEMCEKQRKICADEACTMRGHGCDYDVKVVDQSSILNSPLPEELQ